MRDMSRGCSEYVTAQSWVAALSMCSCTLTVAAARVAAYRTNRQGGTFPFLFAHLRTCVLVMSWMVVMQPCLIPSFSCTTCAPPKHAECRSLGMCSSRTCQALARQLSLPCAVSCANRVGAQRGQVTTGTYLNHWCQTVRGARRSRNNVIFICLVGMLQAQCTIDR